MYEELVLDCKELEAPEPLNLVVDNLNKLDDKTYIKMIHRMEPGLLFNILNQNGYGYKVKYENSDVLVYVWNKDHNDIKNYVKSI